MHFSQRAYVLIMLTTVLAVAEQGLDFMRGCRVDLAPFGGRLGPLSTLARVFEGTNLMDVVTHASSFPPDIDLKTLASGMPEASQFRTSLEQGKLVFQTTPWSGEPL